MHVRQLTNQLRKQPIETLRRHPPTALTTRKFRGEPVCITIAMHERADGGLAFMLRGFIPRGRTTVWDGFTKRPDETWKRLEDDDAEILKAAILAASPSGIGP